MKISVSPQIQNILRIIVQAEPYALFAHFCTYPLRGTTVNLRTEPGRDGGTKCLKKSTTSTNS